MQNSGFKYLWIAEYADGNILAQPLDDRYTKHDDNLEHNPSSFRDLLDYEDVSPLVNFRLIKAPIPGLPLKEVASVDLGTGVFTLGDMEFMLERPLELLKDRQIIYFRTHRMNMQTQEQYIHAYNFGYKGMDDNGKIVEKVVTIQ